MAGLTSKLGLMRCTLAAALVVSVAACTPRYSDHGWMPDQNALSEIVPGLDTRDSVEEILGVPGIAGLVDENGLYYIHSTMRFSGPRRPEVVDRTVVAITFDQDQVVEGVATYGLEDGRVVALERRVTTGAEGNTSILRRLFGNIGGLSAGQIVN